MIVRLNRPRLAAILALIGVLAHIEVTNAQVSIIHLHVFSGLEDGGHPGDGVSQALDGTLYGTTPFDCCGTRNKGTVYRVNPDGTGFRVLHAFPISGNSDGQYPSTAPIVDNDGILYGTTPSGGHGTRGIVYRLNVDGTAYTILHAFGSSPIDGAGPGALVQGSDGALYGTTARGGVSNAGTVFRMATDGTDFVVLYSFTDGVGGGEPRSLFQNSEDGMLFGIAAGGANDVGTLFKLSPDGSEFVILHSFTGGAGGADPSALLLASDGILYGTTAKGGGDGCYFGNDCGTVFQLNTDGSEFTVLHAFSSDDGTGRPRSLIDGGDGTFYGTAFGTGPGNDTGSIFQVGTVIGVLHTFTCRGATGMYPVRLIRSGDGTFYGTTSGYTIECGLLNQGSVFRMTLDGQGVARRSLERPQ